ncbi:hypothetical protein I350_03764 [Cryptococcus amylolentus CBS 6273]|uniref:Protein translocase SEC61 complex gamma subunit, archaeal and eukaryotic n=1 Tax=Cryptococcus amylolentus CBS 6273 TaxID=1296118 RepID=A0A1E3K582_9TREE|nr:hypothetical protein I350_03764 [Cryptococcus amylolentus CBS 6273]
MEKSPTTQKGFKTAVRALRPLSPSLLPTPSPSRPLALAPNFLCRAIAIGFGVMGVIGYVVKLIHIPINNILVYVAPPKSDSKHIY